MRLNCEGEVSECERGRKEGGREEGRRREGGGKEKGGREKGGRLPIIFQGVDTAFIYIHMALKHS